MCRDLTRIIIVLILIYTLKASQERSLVTGSSLKYLGTDFNDYNPFSIILSNGEIALLFQTYIDSGTPQPVTVARLTRDGAMVWATRLDYTYDLKSKSIT